jgi:bifunctional DNase/RNase
VLVKMKIKNLMIDPINEMPIIVLLDEERNRVLPIWVGFFEANAIALKLEGVPTPRPMTHDLIINLFEIIGGELDRIEIVRLESNTYFANLKLNINGKEMLIDCRPSDAIAIALRSDSNIFVEESVIEKASGFEMTDDPEQRAKLRKWLESLDMDSLGKYKM